MSLVRHKDKKSGSIIVYESTSHYDPVSRIESSALFPMP